MKKVTKIEGAQNNITIKRNSESLPTAVFQQAVMLSWKVWKHRKPIMSDTSIPVRIGSSPVSTSMKVSQEPRLKNVRSYFA